MSPKPPKERRQHPRIKAQIPLKIPIGMEQASTLNISLSGACVKVRRYIPLWTKLNLVLVLPLFLDGEIIDEVPVNCTAVVIRSDPERPSDDIDEYEVAFYFSHLDDKAKVLITDYVKYVQSQVDPCF